jgi:lipid-A-disaccharide synthase
LTYCIGKVLVRIPDIGLINIVGGSRIVPELKQNEVTPERIAGECERFLTDVRVYESVKKALGEARARLGEHGASLRAAQIAVEML